MGTDGVGKIFGEQLAKALTDLSIAEEERDEARRAEQAVRVAANRDALRLEEVAQVLVRHCELTPDYLIDRGIPQALREWLTASERQVPVNTSETDAEAVRCFAGQLVRLQEGLAERGVVVPTNPPEDSDAALIDAALEAIDNPYHPEAFREMSEAYAKASGQLDRLEEWLLANMPSLNPSPKGPVDSAIYALTITKRGISGLADMVSEAKELKDGSRAMGILDVLRAGTMPERRPRISFNDGDIAPAPLQRRKPSKRMYPLRALLTDPAYQGLLRAIEVTGDNETDVVCRALLVYSPLVDTAMNSTVRLAIRDGEEPATYRRVS